VKKDFVDAVQKKVAITSICASTLRGQGAAGGVGAARGCLMDLDLRVFSVVRQATFARQLDAVVERGLRQRPGGVDLPAWNGVKRLDKATSAAYQDFASAAAAQEGISRVHLDAFLWVAKR